MSERAPLLTEENFRRGFLLDEELMGGIAEDESTSEYLAFVLNHATGEALAQKRFARLSEALEALNGVARPWKFEVTKACGGSGKCAGGGCKGGGCKAGGCGSGSGACGSGSDAPSGGA